MDTIASQHGFFFALGRLLPPRGWAAALLSAVMLSVGAVRADDCTSEMREAAKTWGMNRIAVIQAANGDVQDAKHTLSQIDEDGPKRPAEVTAVWFCNRTPIYDVRPAPIGWGARDWQGTQFSLPRDRSPDHVATQVPPGLPSSYLAADRHHGPVVDFIDEHDTNGTRVTSRKYADGHVVIETPRP